MATPRRNEGRVEVGRGAQTASGLSGGWARSGGRWATYQVAVRSSTPHPHLFSSTRQVCLCRRRPAAFTPRDARLTAPAASPTQSKMNDQVALVQEALARAQGAGTAGTPIDIAVARQYGDSTVTMRAQVRGGAHTPRTQHQTSRLLATPAAGAAGRAGAEGHPGAARRRAAVVNPRPHPPLELFRRAAG
eukprot:7108909-Prymnesium_polylepis.2